MQLSLIKLWISRKQLYRGIKRYHKVIVQCNPTDERPCSSLCLLVVIKRRPWKEDIKRVVGPILKWGELAVNVIPLLNSTISSMKKPLVCPAVRNENLPFIPSKYA